MKRILSILLMLTVVLSTITFAIPTYAETEEKPLIDEYIWYDDFSSDTLSTEYYGGTLYNSTTPINDGTALMDGYTLTDDDTLKMTGASQYAYFITPWKTLTDKPKLYVSYRIKTDKPTKNRWGNDKNKGLTTVFGRWDGNIYIDQDTTAEEDKVGSFAANEWVTVTCIYDNDANSRKRDIYINGEHKKTADIHSGVAGKYVYSTSGEYQFTLMTYGSSFVTELDDFMVYAYPTELKYELESATANEVKLNLNMIPDSVTVIPENFTVKAGDSVITPATATLSAVDPRQVVLTFSENLQPGTQYTVSAVNLTAGNNDGDVADSLVLTSNPELSFKVSPAKVEWTKTTNIKLYDYESESCPIGTITEKNEELYGAYEQGEDGIYKIEEVDGTKVLTMQQNGNTGVNNTRLRFLPRKANFTSGNAYAAELKIKTDFSKYPENTMIGACQNAGYGLPFTALNNGVIYTNELLQKSIGTYTDGEWLTLKNVYYSTPVSIDLTDDETDNPEDMLRRDIYINGQFIKTEYDSWDDFGKYIIGDQNFSLYFRLRDKHTYIEDTKTLNTVNTEGKVFIDYIRFYKTVDTFAAQLDSETDVDTSYINVKFNNTPVEADLTDKIYVEDESGNKVSAIAVPEFVNDFNADGYAAKVNLWFKDELENGKTYKLCINGVTDIMDNTLYQEETFTTKALPEAEGLTISDGKASVTVNEYSEPLTLYVVGYDVVDGVEQMTTVVTKTINEAGIFSTDTAVIEDVVKAFLWKGTKPVIQFVTEN